MDYVGLRCFVQSAVGGFKQNFSRIFAKRQNRLFIFAPNRQIYYGFSLVLSYFFDCLFYDWHLININPQAHCG